ncbi:chaplin [Streptomyces sp. INR7]|nr:chaplin [Streptomyces sp. INR7]RST10540.1 chaplin [Streptomyces sp. WAC05950]
MRPNGGRATPLRGNGAVRTSVGGGQLPKKEGRPPSGPCGAPAPPCTTRRFHVSRVWKSAGLALVLGLAVIGGASSASADSVAEGFAVGSPGILSGNVVQIPIHIPINVCGNSINVIGALNPAAGNTCVNV